MAVGWESCKSDEKINGNSRARGLSFDCGRGKDGFKNCGEYRGNNERCNFEIGTSNGNDDEKPHGMAGMEKVANLQQ